jgi:hypothetical protein
VPHCGRGAPVLVRLAGRISPAHLLHLIPSSSVSLVRIHECLPAGIFVVRCVLVILVVDAVQERPDLLKGSQRVASLKRGGGDIWSVLLLRDGCIGVGLANGNRCAPRVFTSNLEQYLQGDDPRSGRSVPAPPLTTKRWLLASLARLNRMCRVTDLRRAHLSRLSKIQLSSRAAGSTSCANS